MTIAEAQIEIGARLASYSDAPDLDAERLLMHVTGEAESSRLILKKNLELTYTQKTALERAILQRTSGYPLAYILGTQEFFGRTFEVTPDVLIPRPETESLVLAALMAAEALFKAKGEPLTVADIGTGSGCIAITLLLEKKQFEIKQLLATDASTAALAVARKNAERYGITDKIIFKPGSMLEPLADEEVDLIISNPPYIPSAELRSSIKSDDPAHRGLRFEPREALDGGNDGQEYLDTIRKSGMAYVIEKTGGDIESRLI